jgi:hypothetical protein
MGSLLAGPGQGLSPPQALYPSGLFTTPYTAPTNKIGLSAGQQLLIPAGTWIVAGGAVSGLIWRDPVTEEWMPLTQLGSPFSTTIRSQGFDFAIGNFSGSGLSAQVTNPGSGYVQHTVRVTPSTGNSEWKAVIGGALGPVDIMDPGEHYSIPPIVMIPAPPRGGVCATAIATIGTATYGGETREGAVTGVTFLNPGAGYPFGQTALFVTAPNDPNLERVKRATGRTELVGHGTVTAVLLDNFGAPLPSAPNLNISGGQPGGATAMAIMAPGTPQNDTVTIQPASGP